jgi:hypothetical protein
VKPRSDSSLLDELRRLERVDLAAGVGALHLLPENASTLLRLEFVASHVAQLGEGGERSASGGRIREVLAHKSVQELAIHEDPLDDVVCEPPIFPGGAGLLSTGIAQDAVLTTNLFGLALAELAADHQFARDLQLLGAAVIRLSTTILKAAAIPPYALPGGRRDRIAIPGASVLGKLKEAVRYKRGDLDALLKPLTTAEVLDPLVSEFAGADEAPASTDAIVIRPIVRAGDEYVVLVPLGLGDALRHAIITTADKAGASEELANAFHRQGVRVATDALERIRMQPDPFTPDPPASEALGEHYYRFDDDKVAHLLVIGEDLGARDPAVAHPVWRLGSRATEIEERRRRVAEQFEKEQPGVEIFNLTVLHGAGAAWIGVPGAKQPRAQLGLSLAELDVLSVIERNDPLALYKWARQRESSTAVDFVGAIDRLDSYASYRSRGYAFPAPVLNVHALMTPVGAGIELRAEAKGLRDHHLALYEPGRGVQVERLSLDEPEEPVRRMTNPDLRMSLLIEDYDLPVWIRPPESSSAEEMEGNCDIARMIGFWLGQMASELAPVLAALATKLSVLDIQLEVHSPSGFENADPGRAQEIAAAGVKAEGLGGLSIQIEFKDGAYLAMRGADNRGEREVMLVVLETISELASRLDLTSLTKSQSKRLVEQHMANPRKKHLLVIEASDPALDGRGLPPARIVKLADSQVVKDELGTHLIETLGLETGTVPQEKLKDVLLAAREWCLETLMSEVASVAPAGFLERLVSLNEAHLHSAAIAGLKLPTRLACYESEPEAVARLSREVPQGNLARLAVRFLIEYVTARPPRGDRQVSTALVDRLMALVAEMLDHAAALTAVDKGLSDADYLIDEEGRLQHSVGDTFWGGQSSFLGTFVEGELERSSMGFGAHWREDGDPELPSADRVSLEEPVRAEAGLSLSQLESAVRTLLAAADGRGEPAVVMRSEIVPELAASTDLSDAEAEQAVNFFALGPRDAFYPDSTAKTEVQPWHFNRDLSYNRRPLLLRKSKGGEEVIWARRQLVRAWEIWMAYLLDGKFRAQSKELDSALGRIAKARGRAFEDKVADLYEEVGRFQVLRRRKQLNGVFVVRNDGQDLDVLVADPGQRELIAIDAKDLSNSLSPTEVARELGRNFGAGESKRSGLEKHLDRVSWLEDHVADALVEFDIDGDASRWKVIGMMVTSHDTISPHMTKTAIPVKSYREVRADLAKPPPPIRKRRARRN